MLIIPFITYSLISWTYDLANGQDLLSGTLPLKSQSMKIYNESDNRISELGRHVMKTVQ